MASPYQERRRRWLEGVRRVAVRVTDSQGTVAMPVAQVSALVEAALAFDELMDTLDRLGELKTPKAVQAREALRRLAEVAP